MDAIQKIEAALKQDLPGGRWVQGTEFFGTYPGDATYKYIAQREESCDPDAWLRFGAYLVAVQPANILELLQTLASNAAEVERKDAQIAGLREAGKLAWRALCDAEAVLATVDPEDSSESEKLEELIKRVGACAGVLFCELRLPVAALTNQQSTTE